jgi:hypothetical protein
MFSVTIVCTPIENIENYLRARGTVLLTASQLGLRQTMMRKERAYKKSE